jgi:small subunit ribosomal protein S6
MPPVRTYPYEAMFLIGQAAAANLPEVIDHINEIFHRAGAELIAMKKWDERRLAFEIKKQKRGLYILTYFRAQNTSLPHIERDVNLSERILRVMILRADHLTEDEMRAADARDALETEARMRARQAEEGLQADQPEQPEQPEPQAAEQPEEEGEPAEA